jgi:nitrite reductase (NADH) small subunit
MHKHAFDLRTGRCLDDEEVGVPVYEARVVEGVVLVGRRRRPVS